MVVREKLNYTKEKRREKVNISQVLQATMQFEMP